MKNTIDIIAKKRDAEELTYDEIRHMVMGYTKGEIPDYQMAAFLMSVYFSGMNKEETAILTRAMRDSGETIDLGAIAGIKVDKHSTGGVGDKTTLIVGPTAAACGVPIAKMSGRGLGFTGGTVDKLRSIPGFETSMEKKDFFRQVNEIGIALIGQTGHIAPADKKIYALRDVTATVGNMSLIASSVMSKKLAAGSDAIVLDVKCGKGSFMPTEDKATELAELMIETGKANGKNTVAVITDMNQPLGNAVGNSLEVAEAVDVLHGKGPQDTKELSVVLAGMMVYMGGKAHSIEDAREMASTAIENGSALMKFRELIKRQGGNPEITENQALLPKAKISEKIQAKRDGYIADIDAMKIGLASQRAGAGREKKEDDIDLSAGVLLNVKVGDAVRTGDCICTVCGNDRDKVSAGKSEAEDAFKMSEDAPMPPKLIKKVCGI